MLEYLKCWTLTANPEIKLHLPNGRSLFSYLSLGLYIVVVVNLLKYTDF